MSMVDKIRESRAKGDLYKEASDLERIKSDMSAFKPELTDALHSYERAEAIKKALAKVGKTSDCDVSAGADAISYIQKKLQEKEFAVISAKSLKKDAIKAENVMKNEWLKYYDERTGAAREIIHSVQKLLVNEPDYKTLRDKENAFSVAPAGSNTAFQAIDDYMNAYNRLMGKLNLSDQILAFIQELSEKGSVPLSKLNVEYLDTLQKLEFADKMRITIGK